MTNLATKQPRTATLVAVTNHSARWKPWAVSAIALAVVIALMFTRPDFELIYLGKAVAYAVAILGLNIVVGFSGQLSLAQGAFVGLGAYTAAILVSDYGWPILATFPVAAALGFGVGCLLGLPALRVKGHYLATMTIGVAIIFPLIIKRYSEFTGGANGKLALIDFEAPAGLGLTTVQWRFFIVCIVASLCFVFVRNVIRSRIGRGMAMVRSNEAGALSNGISVAKNRVLAFGYSGLFGAVAGPLLVMMLEVVGPDDFGLMFTILLTTGLIIGGTTRLMGALLGGIIVALLPSLTASVVSGPQANVLYAVLLIGMIFLLPGGLASLPATIRARWRKIRGAAEPESPSPKSPVVPDRLTKE